MSEVMRDLVLWFGSIMGIVSFVGVVCLAFRVDALERFRWRYGAKG